MKSLEKCFSVTMGINRKLDLLYCHFQMFSFIKDFEIYAFSHRGTMSVAHSFNNGWRREKGFSDTPSRAARASEYNFSIV